MLGVHMNVVTVTTLKEKHIHLHNIRKLNHAILAQYEMKLVAKVIIDVFIWIVFVVHI